ncbi:MAG: hypothetical protein H0V91_03705 [Flavisolibacter sp.]|nr:hypothetical protein [Flavisolibacter sp.]
MLRPGFLLLMIGFMACNGNSEVEIENETEFNFERFSNLFKEQTVPFGLPDTTLLNNKDTATLSNLVFKSYIPDSIKTALVGDKNARFIPLYKMQHPQGETYFLTKVISGKKKAAMLTIFDKENNYASSFPFLMPDTDPATSQATILDKSFSISRNMVKKMKDGTIADGKHVYAFDRENRDFLLVMTDLLDDSNLELINPIDTLPATAKYTGDYIKDKKNIVSIRNGRSENEVQIFLHFERKDGCSGEIKGYAIYTSSKTAVFREVPCILELNFSANSVTVKEIEGCGSYRGTMCTFEGSYPKKKTAKPKS